MSGLGRGPAVWRQARRGSVKVQGPRGAGMGDARVKTVQAQLEREVEAFQALQKESAKGYSSRQQVRELPPPCRPRLHERFFSP